MSAARSDRARRAPGPPMRPVVAEAMTAERVPTVSTAFVPRLRRTSAELGPRAQRTVNAILAATRDVFLEQGYGGTSIEDIAQRAGVSRASFYTYFPTKREALLALGTDAASAAYRLMSDLGELPRPLAMSDLECWAERYLDFLDEHGAFSVAWVHAAHEDDELRAAGTHGHLRVCRRLGNALDHHRGYALGDPTIEGLLACSMIDRSWDLARLYEGRVDRDALRSEAARVLAKLLAP